MALALTTEARVKALAGIDADDDTQDAWLAQMIPVFSRTVERYCDREFLIDDYTESFDPDGRMKVFELKAYPIVSVASVTYHGAAYSTSVYKVMNELGLVKLAYQPTVDVDGRLVIVYNGGIAATTSALVADADYGDLVYAVELQLVALLQQRDQIGNIVSIAAGGSSLTLSDPTKWLPEVADILSRYRRMNAA